MNLRRFPWQQGYVVFTATDECFYLGNDGTRTFVGTRDEIKGLENLDEIVTRALELRNQARWN